MDGREVRFLGRFLAPQNGLKDILLPTSLFLPAAREMFRDNSERDCMMPVNFKKLGVSIMPCIREPLLALKHPLNATHTI